MKITTKDLHKWVMLNTPVRYRGEIYRAFYDGKEYRLWNRETNKHIAFYKIKRGVWGLETNKR